MPLFWLSLAFLTGILLASKLYLPFPGWIIPGLLAFLLVLAPIKKHWVNLAPPSISRINNKLRIPGPIIYPLVILFIAIGAIRYQLAQPQINSSSLAYYNDLPQELVLRGVIAQPPDERDTYTNLRVRIDEVYLPGNEQPIQVRGLLLARASNDSEYRYGDQVRLSGTLETPTENEDFSYRDYLVRQSIYSSMFYPEVTLLQHGQGNIIYSLLYSFRRHAQEVIYRIFPDPEASLVAGIVLGVQSGIPAKVQDAFRLTGTSHIIVISGFNISVIAQVFALLFTRFLGRYKGAVLTAVGIILYTLLVGANSAVVRAAIFGLLTLGAHLLGRRQMGVNSLAFAAAVMALHSPTVLWDISFQLSFAATLGIVLYAAPLTEWFTTTTAHVIPPDKVVHLAGPISDYLLVTLAAQITTLPLIIYYFKRFSLSTFIANPLILPAQPPLMVLGGLTAFAGSFSYPIGQVLAWATWPFAAYTIRIVEWLARFPSGSIPLGTTAFQLIIAFYLVLFAFTFARTQISLPKELFKPVYPLGLMIITTFITWTAAFDAPDDLLHVTILDVGTGDAVLVQSPGGRNILINGGPSTGRLSDALGRRLPLFDRSLDWLVIADTDDEDITALVGNLERFTPRHVLWSGYTFGTPEANNLSSEFLAQSIPITTMLPGHVLDLGGGTTLNVVSTNAHGAILMLEWNNFHMLLPVGMDFDTLEDLLQNSAMRNLSVVLLPESGFAPLNPPELIDHFHPQLFLINVALADRSGLPSPETLAALEGYNLLRTDLNGWIELTTDGKQMWVEVERQ